MHAQSIRIRTPKPAGDDWNPPLSGRIQVSASIVTGTPTPKQSSSSLWRIELARYVCVSHPFPLLYTFFCFQRHLWHELDVLSFFVGMPSTVLQVVASHEAETNPSLRFAGQSWSAAKNSPHCGVRSQQRGARQRSTRTAKIHHGDSAAHRRRSRGRHRSGRP